MDIIDILLARKAAQGQAATIMTQAQAALQEATDAADSITSMSSAIETYGEQAQSAYDRATAAADIYDNLIAIADQSIIEDLAALLSEQMLDATIANVEVANGTVEGAITKNIIATKYGGNTTTLEVERNYTTTGQNTDGSMTQKAITDALQSAQVNLGSGNSDKLVKVGSNGELVVSSIDEDDILNGNIHVDPTNPDTPEEEVPMNNGTIGLKLNYRTSNYQATDDAISMSVNDFDNYAMYGGRKRCLVDNNGTIIAFYGDNNYSDISTNGYQVMVYQPKFYYKRTPIQIENTSNGAIIRQEIIKISSVQKEGFKIHPLFVNQNNEILDYVLLSAYEGSIESDLEASYLDKAYSNILQQKLSSVSGAKPITGVSNNLTLMDYQTLANNRGTGWHITNIQALSAEQMLTMVEYGTPQVQSTLSKGVSNFNYSSTSVNVSYAALTGSTSDLGNSSGEASSTYFNDVNTHTEFQSGKKSFSYRGMQNEYGNLWKAIQGILCVNESSNFYTPYICNNFNYSTTPSNNYSKTQLLVPSSSGWISAFGYDSNYDWLFVPSEMNNNANSLGPVGDYLESYYTSNSIKSLAVGGAWGDNFNAGLFANRFTSTPQATYGRGTTARLMYIPQKTNDNYLSNINKWKTALGG